MRRRRVRAAKMIMRYARLPAAYARYVVGAQRRAGFSSAMVDYAQ